MNRVAWLAPLDASALTKSLEAAMAGKPLLAAVALVLAAQVHGEEGLSNRSRIELALRDYAKLMCSAVFISNRTVEEAERNSGPLVTENIGSSYSAISEADRAQAHVLVDRTRKN